MTNLNISTIHFSAYSFGVGDWTEVDSDVSLTYGKVRSRQKGSKGQNEYEVEVYNEDSADFTGETVTLSDKDLSEWNGPQNNSDSKIGETRLNDANIAFSASAITPQRKEIVQDFNEHGIRENRDDEGNLVSVDAVYEAMEPGDPEDRNGVRITSEFLQEVADKEYEKPPYLMDHTKDTLSQIGFVKDVWYNDSTEKLMIMARAYNTGSETHNEIINRLTFDPPTLTDGSVGFGSNYKAIENDSGETEFVDGKLREFSTTPFPAGYDNGGLKTNYNEDDSSEVGLFVVAS